MTNHHSDTQVGERPSLDRMKELIGRFSAAAVDVAGDVVLDEFQFGEIARVSREAPVLILEHRRADYVPGGAGNTVVNLAALGVDVRVFARIGNDAAGETLASMLSEHGADVSNLVRDTTYVTPTKTRILAGSPHTAKQQIVRIDRGSDVQSASDSVRSSLMDAAVRSRGDGRGLILADYGYKLVDPTWMDGLKAGDGPLTLDSRYQLAEFGGIDSATPNLEELEQAMSCRLDTDDESGIAEVAERLRSKMSARSLLVTRGSRGMTLVGEGAPQHVPVFGSDEIADVTGAGDTVIAV